MTPSIALDRRTLVKGAAWSAPLVLASSTIPAYAASTVVPTALTGVFLQIITENAGDPYDTILGVNSTSGGVPDPSGTHYPTLDEQDNPVGKAAVGEGVFTPEGTLFQDSYGGAGLWFSAPVNASTQAPLPGVSTLPSGSKFKIDFSFTFVDEYETLPPLMWEEGVVTKVVTGPSTSRLATTNGARFSVVRDAGVINGDMWTGSITYTTLSDLSIDRNQGSFDLAQLLLSNEAVEYDVVSGMVTAEATLTVLSAPIVVAAEGYDTVTVDLTGRTVSAILSL